VTRKRLPCLFISDRSACSTSTREARAGISEAAIAADEHSRRADHRGTGHLHRRKTRSPRAQAQ
jgi:hypothetical protein